MPKLNAPASPPRSREVPWEKWVVVEFPAKDTQTGAVYRRKVVASVYGGIAVYPAFDPNKQDKWRVAAVRCGLSAALLDTEEEALKVGATLADRFLMAWRKETKEEVLEALPPWVGKWALACTKAGTYLDPAPYQQSGR